MDEHTLERKAKLSMILPFQALVFSMYLSASVV